MRNAGRVILGFLTALTLALFPAVSPVGPFVIGAEAASNLGSGVCAQTVSSTAGNSASKITIASTDYCLLTFTGPQSSTTWDVPTGVTEVDYLIVAGGGGGGSVVGTGAEGAGGGGAGGLLTSIGASPASLSLPATVSITVGAGGPDSSPGQNSSALGLTAIGGGYGGHSLSATNYPGGNGGSGGGGHGWGAEQPGGAGQAGQGFSGGLSPHFGSGGGGGGSASAGSAGANPSAPTTPTLNLAGGDGGDPTSVSITGSAVDYAAGGHGGGTSAQRVSPSYPGSGGSGGTSKASESLGSNSPQDGLAGQDGIVILRYSLQPDPPTSVSVEGGNGSLAITYTPPTYLGGSALDLEYTTDGGANWRSLGESDGATTVTEQSNGDPLVNGTVYTVQLRASNSAGYSSQGSNAVSAMPSPVGEVLRLDATHRDIRVTSPSNPQYNGGDNWNDLVGDYDVALTGAEFDSRQKSFIFDQADDKGALPDIAVNFRQGLAIHAVVDFGDSIEETEKIIDLGNGQNAGNIVFSRWGSDDQLTLFVHHTDNTRDGWCFSSLDAIQPGFHQYSVVVDAQGNCDFFRDGANVTGAASGDDNIDLPADMVRTSNFIGHSNWTGDRLFKGSIQSIVLYNTWKPVPNCLPVEETFPGDGTFGDDGVSYKALAFTTVGDCTWDVPTGVTEVDALLVAGGGGGGAHVGGGGGAGGFLELTNQDLGGASSVDVSVGRGGVGGYCPGVAGTPCDGAPSQEALSGANTSLHTFPSAVGGGAGGSWTYFSAKNGGSGGGSSSGSFGTATSGQGFSGGSYLATYFTGGGGGAGSAGANGASGSPGAGGAGKASSLLPDSVLSALSVGSAETDQARDTYFAGGGGAGYHNWSLPGDFTQALGGIGGGGSGNPGDSAFGTSGKAVSGGGGGAGGGANNTLNGGGDGGSGVLVVRYSNAPGAPTLSTLRPGDSSLRVSFTASSHLAGEVITGYTIQYSTSPTFDSVGTLNSSTTSSTISDLTNGTVYYVRARATYAGGYGEWSESASGTPVPVADYALDFDGANDVLSRSSDQFITDGDYFTIEAWVYDEDSSATNGVLRLGTNTTKRVFIQTLSSSNYISVGINGLNTHQNTQIPLPQNQWVHLALTRSGNTWSLYLNGRKVYSGSQNPQDFDTGGLLIGAADGTPSNMWRGQIDQVKIWDYPLTDAEVALSMHTHSTAGITTNGATEPDLIAHYDFNAVNTSTVSSVVGTKSLTVAGSMTDADFVDVANITTTNGVRTVTFPRSYLTQFGGWSVPAGVDGFSLMAVGGGGGGGSDSSGGGGGGARIESTVDLGDEANAVMTVKVGQGGLGSSWSQVGEGANSLFEWAGPGQATSVTLTDSSSGTLAFSAGGGEGGEDSSRTATLTNGGANEGDGAAQPSSPTDNSTPFAVSGVSRVAGGAGGNPPGVGYQVNGNGSNGAGGGTSTTFGGTYGGGGGGGGSGSTSQGGVGVNGGGNGAGGAVYATSARVNSGGGGGGGSASGSTSIKFPNFRDGFAGAAGVVAVRYGVLTPPSVSSDPADQSVQVNDDPTFSVTATGTNLSYQWQVSSDGGGSWSDIAGATADTLSLTDVTVAMTANQYRVVVTSTVNSEEASVTSDVALLTVQDGVTVNGAFCDGTYTKNGLTVAAGHGDVFYIDTGQGQEIDAGYVAYRVTSTSARSDLWVELSGFTGGVVSLANAGDSALPLGTVTANGTRSAYFMIKASGATATPQSHTLKIYAQKPSIGSPQPLYTCGFSFTEVQETIKAAANKVNSITSTTATKIGSTMTITVLGDTGTIGQGNDIDGRMIWLTPAARSDWPTEALRLQSVTLSLYSNSQRTNLLTTHTDTLRVNAATTPALSGNNRQYYRAEYTFRIIGPAASTAPIIPIAMISSGTQIKHTDVGSLPTGGTATVDLRSPTVDLVVTKSVSSSTTINADGTTSLDYSVTLTNNGADALTIDEVIDNPDSQLTYVAGSSTFNSQPMANPGLTGASSLAFSGPLVVPGNTSRVISYEMTFETCAVGSSYDFDNTATARTGTVVIGSGSATQSAVTIAGNCGEPEATVTVVDEPIAPAATTGVASSVTATAATIAGVVDPNSQSGLAVRFVYSTNSNLSGATSVDLATTTFSDTGYGVETDLSSLSSGTTYYYRLEVQDADGNWVTGTTRSFTTLQAPSAPVAVTTTESSLTTTSAVLNGTIDPNYVTGGAKARFEWAVDSGSTCSSLGAVSNSGFLTSESASGGFEDAVLSGSSATAMSYPLTGLTVSTNYCYRIVAFSGSGFSSQDTGNWEPFTTGNVTAQTITWGTSANPLPAGGTTTVTATASSGLSVTYSSVDTNICTVDSSTGVVTAVASSGTCTITASQSGGTSGGTTYSAATPKSISFVIVPPVVTPSNLVSGTFQTSGYSQTLQATGGNGTYSSWAVSSGSLPAGLTLNSSTGVISGTPTSAGIYTFAVTVASNGVTSAPQTFTITVAKKTVTVTASSPSVVFGSAAPTIAPSYSGFVGSDATTVSTSPNVAPNCTSTYTVGQNAGTTAVSSCSGGLHENYIYTFVNGAVTVTKFPVTITALDAAKQNVISGSDTIVYADPELRWTATSPLPAGQTMADVIPGGVTISRANAGTAAGTYLTTALATGELAATYAIAPSGTAGDNYEVTFVNGLFTIQNPLEVPTLAVSNKSMTYGDSNTASTFIGGSATNRANTSVAGTYVYRYIDSNGDPVELDDLSTLGAGTYLVSVVFTPTDVVNYYHDANAPLTETMLLTIERKAVTVTAADKKKEVGALDPTLTWSGTGFIGSDDDSVLGPITISRAPGELAASYAITTTGGDTPNYQVTHVAGSFYIFEPVITVTQSRGVLTSRSVGASVKGAKAGSSATFTLITGGTPSTLGTCTVASDGTCTISATLDETVGQGVHSLKVESTEPLDGTFQKTQSIILLASRIQVITNGGGSSGGTPPSRRPVVTPLVPPGQNTLPVPGAVPRPAVPPGQQTPPTQVSPTLPENAPRPTPNAQSPVLPSLPGLGRVTTGSGGTNPSGGIGSPGATVDFGSGVQQITPDVNGAPSDPASTTGNGRRTVSELANERLGGFQPGASTRIEVLGARTGARFVVTEAVQLDALTVIRAIQNSVPAQSANFFALQDVRQSAIAPTTPEPWTPEEREAIGEFFGAAGLEEPVSLADIDTSGFTQWVQVTGSGATYLPGSVVYLTLTSDPLVLSSGVVSDDGTVTLSGALPVEWLSAGEHRVRLVGIRSLDGVSVDDDGQIQLSDELMDEIQRFDLGTQSTIAVTGTNPEGGTHAAIRVVPLIPVAPWWTLWFIAAGLLLGAAARWLGLATSPGRRLVVSVAVLLSATPAVIIGWLSTVVAVTWWGLGLGLLAALFGAFSPERRDQAAKRS